ncbi:MAG: Maf family protein [Gemmatimonadota bacterium]
MSLPQPLVLASRSPRRRELLEMLGIPIRVEAADVQEIPLPREAPLAYAQRLARDKARAVTGAFVLGADTIVVVDGEILEKPSDEAAAVAMLRRLAGRRHEVITAVALLAEGELHAAHEVTGVWFAAADEATLRAYVAVGESMDKAGAYSVQGCGAVLVERIEGDFFGVMGLPLRKVLELLARAGHPYRFGG